MPSPYFNEPGYEHQRGSEQGQRRCREYNDGIHLHTIRLAMLSHLRSSPAGFEEVVRRHFAVLKAPITAQCAEWAARATTAGMRAEIARVLAELSAELAALPNCVDTPTTQLRRN